MASSKSKSKLKDLTIIGKSYKNPNPTKPVKNAKIAYNSANSKYKKAKKKYENSKAYNSWFEVNEDYQYYAEKRDKARAKGNKVAEAKWQKLVNSVYPNWIKASKPKEAMEKAVKSKKSAKDKAKKTLDKAMVKDNKNYTINRINSKIATNKKKWSPQGKAAIFQTSGSDRTIIYMHPTDTESVTTSSNVTSWAVDKGSPRSNYARISSKQVTVSGVLTEGPDYSALAKYDTLRTWNSRHYELTYKGNIYLKHLIISNLERSYSGFKKDIKVSITFTFVYAAEVTTKSNSKKSKSKKNTSGSRNSKYTAITIKPGDTLYGLSKKYGKSIAWLQKVNKISNPNLIYAGSKLRVK